MLNTPDSVADLPEAVIGPLDRVRDGGRVGETEEWRQAIGLVGYEVSSFGRVRSFLKRGRYPGVASAPQRVLAQRVDREGYRTVRIQVAPGGPQARRHVHRLVGDAFYGPLPKGMVTRHLDGDVANNRSSNLRHGTHAENALDRGRHGRTCRGDDHPSAKLDWGKVREIREGGDVCKAYAQRFGVSESLVAQIRRGTAWKEGHLQ